MASVVVRPPQLAGPVRVAAGRVGSNGSTMLTNGAAEALALPVAWAAAAEVAELLTDPEDPEEPQAARRPAQADEHHGPRQHRAGYPRTPASHRCASHRF